MTFLAGILATVIEKFLIFLCAIGLKVYKQNSIDEKAASDAKANADTLKTATTEQEIDKATDSTLGNL